MSIQGIQYYLYVVQISPHAVLLYPGIWDWHLHSYSSILQSDFQNHESYDKRRHIKGICQKAVTGRVCIIVCAIISLNAFIKILFLI